MVATRRHEPYATSPGDRAHRPSGRLDGLRRHPTHEGSALCSTQHGCPCRRPAAARLLRTPSDCPDRLKIGYQITAGRLQGLVEFAYRTDWTQVTTTVLWGGRIDDPSRRALTAALRAATGSGRTARIHAFAAVARDLFRHAARALAARRRARAPQTCAGHPTDGGPLHDGLLAAARDLREAARLGPRVTVLAGADAEDSLQDALTALQAFAASLSDYLDLVLQPLTLPISRDAIHAFILETRREVDELSACWAVGDGYVEELTVTESEDKAISLEVEGWLGDCGGVRSAPWRSASPRTRVNANARHRAGTCPP